MHDDVERLEDAHRLGHCAIGMRVLADAAAHRLRGAAGRADRRGDAFAGLGGPVGAAVLRRAA